MDDTVGHKYQSQWWKDLCRVSGKGLQGNWFDSRFQWIVGDRQYVKFWDDRWADGQVLKESFPRLYTISQNKESLLGDLVDWVESRSTRCQFWNLRWHKERFEWEKHLQQHMLAMITKVLWNGEGHDRLVWVGVENQVYTIKSGYSILNNEELLQNSEAFQLLWNLEIAPSIVCGWRLLLDRIPTRINLGRRGIQVGSMQCPSCQEGIESA